MTRPLIPLLICFITGLLLGSVFQNSFPWISPIVLPVCTIAFGFFSVLCYASYRLHSRRLSTIFFLLLAILTGCTRSLITNSISEDHISKLVSDELVTIEGYVDQPVELLGIRRHVYLSVNWVEKGRKRYKSRGRIRLTLSKPSWLYKGLPPLMYGDAIRVRVQLAPPENFSDDFDYREYLRRRDVYLLGTQYHERNLIRLPERQGSPILRQIYQLRTTMLDFLDAYPRRKRPSDPRERQAIQIIKAMTVGEKRGLPPEIRERFRQSGMYHFLVISGVHIGILAWGGHLLLQFFRIPLRVRNALLPLFLCCYAALTGFQFPVMRAVIMASVFYLSITCSRVSDSLYSLLFSVGLLLVLVPNALHELSFQLTVAATASIILFFRFFQRRGWQEPIGHLAWPIRMGVMSMMATGGAMLGVAPLLLHHFGQLSPWSFLSNPLAMPIISLFLPTGLLTNLLALLGPATHVLLWPLLSFNVLCTRLLMALSELFPRIELETPRLPFWSVILYYVLLFTALAYQPKIRSANTPEESRSRQR